MTMSSDPSSSVWAAPPQDPSFLLRRVGQLGLERRFCDLKLLCGPGHAHPRGEGHAHPSLYCHKLILAAMSSTLCRVLRSAADNNDDDDAGGGGGDVTTLLLPDLDHDEVSQFLRTVYQRLAGADDADADRPLPVPTDLAELFALGDSALRVPQPSTPKSAVRSKTKSCIDSARKVGKTTRLRRSARKRSRKVDRAAFFASEDDDNDVGSGVEAKRARAENRKPREASRPIGREQLSDGESAANEDDDSFWIWPAAHRGDVAKTKKTGDRVSAKRRGGAKKDLFEAFSNDLTAEEMEAAKSSLKNGMLNGFEVEDIIENRLQRSARATESECYNLDDDHFDWQVSNDDEMSRNELSGDQTSPQGDNIGFESDCSGASNNHVEEKEEWDNYEEEEEWPIEGKEEENKCQQEEERGRRQLSAQTKTQTSAKKKAERTKQADKAVARKGAQEKKGQIKVAKDKNGKSGCAKNAEVAVSKNGAKVSKKQAKKTAETKQAETEAAGKAARAQKSAAASAARAARTKNAQRRAADDVDQPPDGFEYENDDMDDYIDDDAYEESLPDLDMQLDMTDVFRDYAAKDAEMELGKLRRSTGVIDNVELIAELSWRNARQVESTRLKCAGQGKGASNLRGLFGLSYGVDSTQLRACPLAWNKDSGVDREAQIRRAVSLFRQIGGFSDEDLFADDFLLRLNGLTATDRKKRMTKTLREKYKDFSAEELLSKLGQFENSATFARIPPEGSFAKANLYQLPHTFNLPLDPQLIGAAGDSGSGLIDQVALLMWTESGFVSCFPLVFCQARRKESCLLAMKLLLDLFEVKVEDKGKVKGARYTSDYLVGEYDRMYELFHAQDALRPLMPKGSARRKEHMCPDCGEIFVYAHRPEDGKIWRRHHVHKMKHFYEKFQCQCSDGEFKSFKKKRDHVRLHHSDGKYTKCQQCDKVGTLKEIETHSKHYHQNYVCEECGKVSESLGVHRQHVYVHRTYKCDECDESFLGQSNYHKHKEKTHRGKYECDICKQGNFHLMSDVKMHKLRKHTAEKDRPLHCEECGKGFVNKLGLKKHMLNMHIKSRPFVCRYGCGCAYNDSSNLSQHEKRRHGKLFSSISESKVYQEATKPGS